MILLGLGPLRAQIINGDFEAGIPASCICAPNFMCQNDAGWVVDGFHPVWATGVLGCVVGTTNYASPLGAHSGIGYMYFYAGADQMQTFPALFFAGGEVLDLCIWYSGPPAPATAGQNSAASHFKFGLDGVQVGPNVLVPEGTGWTQHCVTLTMTAGPHVFNVLSGNAAQYTIWFDDFTIEEANDPCDPVVIVGDSVFCEGGGVLVEALSATAVDYLWNTGDDGSSIFVSVPGTYWVDVTDDCGTSSDTLVVTMLSWGELELGSDTLLCNGATLLLDAGVPGASYTWQDGSTGSTFLVDSPGYYAVEVIDACGWNYDDITVGFVLDPVVDLGVDQTICSGGATTLDATTAGATYLWSNGAIDPTVTVDQAGTWWVEVSTSCATITDSVELFVTPLPTVALGADTTLCGGGNMLLNASFPYATYLWQDGSIAAVYSVTTAGTYSVTVTSPCGTATDAITVGVTDLPTVDLGNDASLCPGETLLLDATSPGASYYWSNGSTLPTLLVVQPGTYTVQVSVPCGSVVSSVMVDYNVIPMIELGNDTILCEGSTLDLNVTSPSGTYLWQDGATTSTYSITTPGSYWVTVGNPCGSTTDTIAVEHIPIPTLDLGNDSTLCQGESLILGTSVYGATYLWNTGSVEPSITVNEEGIYSVQLAVSCITLVDSVQVDILDAPVIELPRDTVLCEAPLLMLDVSTPGSTYLWQDGSIGPYYIIETSGVYQVLVTNRCGRDELSMVVSTIDCSCSPFVPNAFTPNSDGDNDHFLPQFLCDLDDYELLIFDRWGELIVTVSDPGKGWDGTYNGTIAQDGVYVYTVNYKSPDQGTKHLYGHVTLLR